MLNGIMLVDGGGRGRPTLQSLTDSVVELRDQLFQAIYESLRSSEPACEMFDHDNFKTCRGDATLIIKTFGVDPRL